MSKCAVCDVGNKSGRVYEIYHISGSWTQPVFEVRADHALYHVLMRDLGGVPKYYRCVDETFESKTIEFYLGIFTTTIQFDKQKPRSSDGNDKKENSQPINFIGVQQTNHGQCERGAIFNHHTPRVTPFR